MMLQKKRLLNQSGWQIAWHQYLPTLKKRNYYVVKDVSIGGDAPKDFIKVYEYGQTYRANRPKWVAYIAKVGHKWYPVESIKVRNVKFFSQIAINPLVLPQTTNICCYRTKKSMFPPKSEC